MGDGFRSEEWLPGSQVVLYANSNTSFELRDLRWIVCNRLLKVEWELTCM